MRQACSSNEVREAQDFDGAFAVIRMERVEALLVYAWGIGPADQRTLVALAAAHRLPASGVPITVVTLALGWPILLALPA